MGNPIWLQVAEGMQNLLTAVGIVVAGIWTYQHFIYRREHETALQIDLSGTSEPYGHNTWLTFLDVCVTNKGRVKLAARKKQSPAYRDKHKNDTFGQEFNYGLDLNCGTYPLAIRPATGSTGQMRCRRNPGSGGTEKSI
jgi:hypothetical protein